MAAAILTALIALMVMEPTSTKAQTLSSDATLSVLTVNPGTVHGFAADRISYEVGVASTVAQATVAGTTTHSGASVAVMPTNQDTPPSRRHITL